MASWQNQKQCNHQAMSIVIIVLRKQEAFQLLLFQLLEINDIYKDQMSKKVYIVGVGMTAFLKPSDANPDYPEMAKVAINRALTDAACNFNSCEAAICGYVYGDSTCGQRAVYEVGMSGIPIYNVNNNCATGSSALHLAKNLIAGGVYSCVLAVGFQKMEKGSLGIKFPDRTNPIGKLSLRSMELHPMEGMPKAFAPMLFGNAATEHMKEYGTKPEHFSKIAAKNHKHSLNNPYSQFRKGYSLEQIQKSPNIHGVLTKLQCCPTSDGAGAAILCDEATMKKLKRQNEAIQILSMELTTDFPTAFDNAREVIGYSMAKECARKAFEKAGIKPSDVGVVELHDCFSANELVTYEALGLCEEGKAGQFIDRGDNTYGGKYVVNPSGGLTSKGHPLGATGFAQCAELSWQLRGIAAKRQVPNLKYALQHNLGLGGACVVAIYKKYNNEKSRGTSDLKELQALEAKTQPVAKL